MSASLMLWFALGLALVPGFGFLFRALTVSVEDEEAVVVTRFGKLQQVLVRPGLHILPEKLLPWVKVTPVSLRRDFRDFNGVHVNAASGTTVIVDLWVEFRVKDPVRALYAVEDRERALSNLVAHAATGILASCTFDRILRNRMELSERLRLEVQAETERWGLEVEFAFVRKVNLLPDVSRQVMESIAARLERAKADVEEAGHLQIAKLNAQTDGLIAERIATAKGQYLQEVGRGMAALRATPEVYASYNELYELSLLHPHRTVAFRGFDSGELRAADAAMMQLPPTE